MTDPRLLTDEQFEKIKSHITWVNALTGESMGSQLIMHIEAQDERIRELEGKVSDYLWEIRMHGG